MKPADVESPAPAPMSTASAFFSACFSFSICAEKSGVDFPVEVFEHIEDHLFHAGFLIQEGFDGLNGDLRRLFVRKMEFAGGDA